MRGGKFLAEESPDFLLQQYGTDNLEEVFLKLSVLQNMGKRRRSSIVQEVSGNVQVPAISVSGVILDTWQPLITIIFIHRIQP